MQDFIAQFEIVKGKALTAADAFDAFDQADGLHAQPAARSEVHVAKYLVLRKEDQELEEIEGDLGAPEDFMEQLRELAFEWQEDSAALYIAVDDRQKKSADLQEAMEECVSLREALARMCEEYKEEQRAVGREQLEGGAKAEDGGQTNSEHEGDAAVQEEEATAD
jgi:hypothetical protein